jgi:ketose-bisphosphate aldolase
MIDASSKSLEENIRMVKEVCEYAHKRGSYVEAELGRIFSNNEEGIYEGEDYLVRVEDAVTLVRETHVDYLAVGIGTAHGFYKGKPNIHFKRLKEINEAIDIPLVLHGGTGIPVEDIHSAIVNGINKVNIGAALRYAYVMSLKSQLADMESTAHPLDIHIKAREAVKTTVVDGIRSVKAAGKA